MKALFTVISLLGMVLLSACRTESPACPDIEKPLKSPSAGCLVLRHGSGEPQLLVVQGYNNKLSVPGGGTNTGESSQCAAHRETWEETGLDVHPDWLIGTFNNGFHLYHCLLHEQSGEIDPPMRMEIKAAFWLAPSNFDDYEWRFEGQQHWLRQWINRFAPYAQNPPFTHSAGDQ